MPFLEFLFSPQAHKFRNGYYINHDTLLAGIFFLILQSLLNLDKNLSFISLLSNSLKNLAEKIASPMKIKGKNKQLCRVMNIGIPRTIWMVSALVGPLAYYLAFKRNRVSGFRSTAILLGLGAVLTPLAGSVYTRVYEGRFVESSKVIEELVIRL